MPALTGEMGRLCPLRAPGDGLFFLLAALMMFLAKIRWLALLSWMTAGDWHLVSQRGDRGEVTGGLKRVPGDGEVVASLWIGRGEWEVGVGL